MLTKSDFPANFPETYIEGFHNEIHCKKMVYKELGQTGMNVSQLGLGCSSFGGCFGEADEDQSHDVLEEMIQCGINYIDTAPWYGNAEEVVGRGFRKKNIPRKSYYISTKVGRYQCSDVCDMFDFSGERVAKSIENSLEKLGVDYLDLVQIHDMEFAPSIDIIINETLPALEKAKRKGKIRFIGITGYPLQILRDVLERSPVKIDTVLSYCHFSINDDSLKHSIPYFQSKGVGIINASSTGMGLMTNNGPPAWHPAHSETKDACRQAVLYAQEQSVDIARLSVHFSVGHPDISTTLTSASQIEYMRENIDVVLNGITEHEQIVLKEIHDKFFKNLKIKSWEGKEVEDYRQKLAGSKKNLEKL